MTSLPMDSPRRVRVAELIGGTSLACDAANGFPPGKVLRTVTLAAELAAGCGLAGDALRDAYFTVLFRFLGCTGFSHEEAHEFGAGDDITTRNTMALADPSEPLTTVGAIVSRIGRGGGAIARMTAVGRLLATDAVTRHAHAQCETAVRLAELARMSAGTLAGLRQTCERWDGKGAPHRAAGEALTWGARILHAADALEIAFHRGGPDAAVALARRRRGKHLAPDVADLFVKELPVFLRALEPSGLWERFLAAEPAPHAWADGDEVTTIARALAHVADLKSGYTIDHSIRVAGLVGAAGPLAGLPAESTRTLVTAGYLHDLGRLAISNRVWDLPGKLGIAEWESVRLHAWHTDRVLAQVPSWRDVAAIAAGAHERLDGTGYHRGLPGSALRFEAQLLAVADAVAAMGEPRAYREPLAPERIRDEIDADVKAGRLAARAADAVLAAASLRAARPARSGTPGGLTDREVEVLTWLARGKTNKEIGQLLDISPRTVQNHIASIYDKLGLYSRAGATLFAVENQLL
ncbi:MAG: HD domain-containing protein [Myxococcales bacterium]|nr:HD domain-containing protein [Myxococcales bacterium]